MGKFLRSIDLVALIIISFVGILLTIIDTFDLNEKIKALKFITDFKYPAISVGILSLLSSHLVGVHFRRLDFYEKNETEQKKFLSVISEQSQALISSLDGIKIRYFENMADLENYLAVQIVGAKREVCDLSWKESISQGYDQQPRIESRGYFEKNLKTASEKIVYREIFVFNDIRRFEKLEKRINENSSGYSCRYFEDNSYIPRLQFVIIDDTEIVFASSSYPKLCSIIHPALLMIFKSYYETCWSKAIPLKENGKWNHEIINQLKKKLKP